MVGSNYRSSMWLYSTVHGSSTVMKNNHWMLRVTMTTVNSICTTSHAWRSPRSQLSFFFQCTVHKLYCLNCKNVVMFTNSRTDPMCTFYCTQTWNSAIMFDIRISTYRHVLFEKLLEIRESLSLHPNINEWREPNGFFFFIWNHSASTFICAFHCRSAPIFKSALGLCQPMCGLPQDFLLLR